MILTMDQPVLSRQRYVSRQSSSIQVGDDAVKEGKFQNDCKATVLANDKVSR